MVIQLILGIALLIYNVTLYILPNSSDPLHLKKISNVTPHSASLCVQFQNVLGPMGDVTSSIDCVLELKV